MGVCHRLRPLVLDQITSERACQPELKDQGVRVVLVTGALAVRWLG